MNAVEPMVRAAVAIDGEALSSQLESLITEIVVRQVLSAPSQCELTFVANDGERVPEAFRPGAELEIRVCDSDIPLFVGHVTGVSVGAGPGASKRWRLRGYDKLHALRRRTVVRSHVQVTLGDLAREVAGEAGLRVATDDDGPLWSYLIQRESDLAFLDRLASRAGLFVTVRGQTLSLVSLAGLDGPLSLTVGENLLEGDVDRNGARVCASVEADAWTPHSSNTTHAHVDEPTEARQQRLDRGSIGPRLIINAIAEDTDHTDRLAQAELDRSAADEVTLRGVALGDPRLRPATLVELDGLGPTVDGRHMLSRVTHRLEGRRGYLSHVSTDLPKRAATACGSTMVPGVVVSVEDPEERGRVRVRFPSFQDVESDWMRALSLGAGADKGLVVIPGQGDHVLVLLGQDDPAHGVVLGGLFAGDPPGVGVVDGEVKRTYLHTASGHRMTLDDDSGIVRVENAAGSYVRLSPSGVTVHAAGDLDLEAPGHALRLRAAAIELEKA